MKFERHILFLSLASGLLSMVIALICLWISPATLHIRVTLTLLMLLWSVAFSLTVRSKVAFPLRTMANLVGALGEGDYSMRIKRGPRDDVMGELATEVNALSQFLQEQRFSVMESTALLHKVLAEIDISLFGFDADNRLQWINESGQKLMAGTSGTLMGRKADALGLTVCLTGSTPRLIDLSLPGRIGRWELRRTTYRDKGQSHHLVFLSDMTRTLHEEERLAWKRLLKILRHEINNSLAPIQSVAQTLQRQIPTAVGADVLYEDLREGLQIIAERSDILGTFIASYSQLTRLPEPTLAPLDVMTWIKHVVGLETRLSVDLSGGPPVTICADRSQLDQLLINVLSNAVEASLQAHPNADGKVSIAWHLQEEFLVIPINDDGSGLNTDKDPFVPFFTTKPKGSGIGLALSRQIAEAHDGEITLVNRTDHSGCCAELRLPVKPREQMTDDG